MTTKRKWRKPIGVSEEEIINGINGENENGVAIVSASLTPTWRNKLNIKGENILMAYQNNESNGNNRQ